MFFYVNIIGSFAHLCASAAWHAKTYEEKMNREEEQPHLDWALTSFGLFCVFFLVSSCFGSS